MIEGYIYAVSFVLTVLPVYSGTCLDEGWIIYFTQCLVFMWLIFPCCQ